MTQDITITVDSGYQVDFASGGLNAPFSFSFDTCASGAGGFTGPGTCNVKESFTPTVVGTFSDTLNVYECPTGGGSCIPIPIPLSSNGMTPANAKVEVIKTVLSQLLSGGEEFTFELRQGASTTSGGAILEVQKATAANNGVVNFVTQLAAGQHYQLCEWVFPGWFTSLGLNLFVPDSIIPPNLPNTNVNDLTVCTDFLAYAGQTITFTVDNTPPPGERPLGIGFWKNWSSCAKSRGKGQDSVLDQTLAIAASSTTDPPGGLGTRVGDVLKLLIREK